MDEAYTSKLHLAYDIFVLRFVPFSLPPFFRVAAEPITPRGFLPLLRRTSDILWFRTAVTTIPYLRFFWKAET